MYFVWLHCLYSVMFFQATTSLCRCCLGLPFWSSHWQFQLVFGCCGFGVSGVSGVSGFSCGFCGVSGCCGQHSHSWSPWFRWAWIAFSEISRVLPLWHIFCFVFFSGLSFLFVLAIFVWGVFVFSRAWVIVIELVVVSRVNRVSRDRSFFRVFMGGG